jgi:hypothetical protein
MRVAALRCMAALVLSAAAATAPAQQRMPLLHGYAWALPRFPSSVIELEEDNAVFEGAVRQSLDFAQLGAQTYLGLFAQAYYSVDSEDLDWNNKLRGSLAAQLRAVPLPGLSANLGAMYEWERWHATDRTFEGVVGFLDWDGRWRPGTERMARPWGIRTLGTLRYPSSLEPQERENLLLQGVIEAGRDLWASGAGGFALNGFAELGFKVDTEQIDRYNVLAPGVGARIRLLPSERSTLELGAKYVSETRFRTDVTEQGLVGFLAVVAWW